MDDIESVIEERKTLMEAVKGATKRIQMIDDMLLSQLEEDDRALVHHRVGELKARS